MARSWTVLGAMGTGPFAPLLAEQRWEGGTRRVVLGRPAPEAVAAMSGSENPHLVPEQDVVELRGKRLGVRAFAPGQTVGQLLDARSEGLPPRALAQVLSQAIVALDAAPVSHGALSPSCFCISTEGWLRLVGFCGREGDDLDSLADLGEAWGELSDGLLSAVRAGQSEVLASAPLEGPTLAELVTSTQPTLHAHAWTGETLTEAQAAEPVNPKALNAAFGASTLVLGFATGWMMKP